MCSLYISNRSDQTSIGKNMFQEDDMITKEKSSPEDKFKEIMAYLSIIIFLVFKILVLLCILCFSCINSNNYLCSMLYVLTS